MIPERITELLARKLGNAAAAEELEELERLLAAHPEYRFMEEITGALESSGDITAQEIATDGWQQLEARLDESDDSSAAGGRIKGMYKRIWWAAASLLLVASAAGWLWKKGKTRSLEPAATYSITAHMGGTTRAVLPDGTKIWLNAGSRLRYGNSFMDTSREVTLDGEAFFDVVKDEARPFIVHTRSLNVKVLGTSFNVRAYGDDRRAETTVLEGKVQVQICRSPENKVVLQPNEKLVLATEGTLPGSTDFFQVLKLAGLKDTLVVETAWREQKLAFMNETFEEVARKMERQFDVKIYFGDESLKQEILSGVFEKEGIDKALRLLQMTTGFHYRIVGQEVWLTR